MQNRISVAKRSLIVVPKTLLPGTAKYLKASLLALFLATLLGCEQKPAPDDYFPLNAGLSWEYQVTRISEGQKEVDRFRIDNVSYGPRQDLGEELAGFDIVDRRTSDGTHYYLYKDEGYLYRAGKRTLIEYKPRIDSPQRLIMPTMDDMEAGATWNLDTVPYLIHSTHSHVSWEQTIHEFDLAFELVSTDETLSTPAGNFSNCLKIEGRALIGLYADPKLGYQELEVIQTEWYAPGIGLVKLVREEPLEMEMFVGGTLSYELVRYHQ